MALLKLDGFEDFIKRIEKAGGTIDKAAHACVKQSAQIMHNELKKQMQSKKVDNGLINRMPAPEVETDHNRFTARVGYKKGNYNPDDLSDGYKAVFINYGTPRISPREFIKKAKSAALKKIKKEQDETYKQILEELGG